MYVNPKPLIYPSHIPHTSQFGLAAFQELNSHMWLNDSIWQHNAREKDKCNQGDFQNAIVNAVTEIMFRITQPPKFILEPPATFQPQTCSHMRDFVHFKQWPHGWPQPTKLNISKTKFILLFQIPSPALSSHLHYLFGQMSTYLEDNLKSKCLSKNAPSSPPQLTELVQATFISHRSFYKNSPPNFIEI